VVAVGLSAGVSAAGPGDEVVKQEEVTTQQTDEVESLLEYGTNQGNFTTIQGQGVLEAIGDWRDGDITTLELFEVVDFFRSEEKLINVQFEPQESPGGMAVNVTTASIASSDELNPPDELVVTIENESGVLSESDVVSGAATNLTVDGLDLDFEIGERVNLTATVNRVDNGSAGQPFLIGAGLQEPAPINQTAEVNPLQKGLYFLDENLSSLDVTVGAGENATVTVVTEAISEIDINGTITLESDSFDARVREIGPAGASDGEFVNETFELPTAGLSAGQNLTYDVIVETDGETIQDAAFGNVVTVQDLTLAEQAVGTSGGSPAVLVENVFAGENQTVEVRNASGGLVGSTELDGPVSGRSVVVPVDTTAGEHTATLLRTDGDAVTSNSAVVYGTELDIQDQAYTQPTTDVVVNSSDVQPETESDYVVVLHNQTGVAPGGVGPPIGSSGNLTGAQSDVTVSLDAGETLNTTTDVLAMLHFPSATGDFGTPIPAVDGSSFGQVTDTAEVSIIDEQVAIVTSPAETDRGDNLSSDVTAEVTAAKVGTQNTVETTVTLVFEGLPGETGTVLGTETVEVAAGATEQVTFDGLARIPNATTATDGEPVPLRVAVEDDDSNASVTTNLSHPVQNAVDFAGLGDTVEVLAGTYDESVKVDKSVTVEGPNAGTPGDGTRSDEAVITGGAVDNTPGLQVAADNVTIDGVQVENTDTNGIRFGPDTVPSNVTIQNSVVTNVTGSAGGKSAGNGIQFQFTDVANETAENIRILDNEISNISTPDATNAETIAIGVNVLPRGNNVSLEIRGNTFDNIEPGASTNNRAEARGVSLSTQDDNENGFGRVDGAVVTNNTFSNIAAGDIVRAVALFEEDDLDPREGVKNFSVTRNNFTSLSGADVTTTGAVFVGGYETLGTGVVTENNFDSGGVLRFANDSQIGSGFDPANAEDLNAVENWWGNESGPSGAGDGVGNPVSENVTFDPWLDAPFPAGNPVSDAGIEANITDSPSTAERPETVTVEANVTNALDFGAQANGAAVNISLVFNDGQVTELDQVNESIVAGETATVTLTGALPESTTTERGANYELRVEADVADDSRSGSDSAPVTVSNSIQAAINAASPGGTVDVVPGTYDESVTVNKSVTVDGPNAGLDGASTARGPEAVVTSGLQIVADNVTVDGLQVENAGRDGIRFGPDTVPSNVTIQNSVVTNVTGTVGGKSAANGIQFQFGSPVDQTAGNIQILDNEVSDISSPDTSGETDAIGVNVLPRGNNVDLEIRGNTFNGIEAGNDTSGSGAASARAISLDTQDDNESGFGRVDGAVVTNNTFDGITADDVRAIALFEDGRLDPREGVEDFSITRNNFTDLALTPNATQPGPAAVFVGGYETLGTGVVTENNIESGAVFRTNNSAIPGFDLSNAEDLNATENWWGNETGPSGAGFGVGSPVSGNVTFDPWLDAPYPSGVPVSDNNINQLGFQGDSEVIAGQELAANSTIENQLQEVGTNSEPGRPIIVEHVLLTDSEEIVLESRSVKILPGGQENVTFSSTVPERVADTTAEHEIRVRDESRGTSVAVYNGNVTFSDQALGTNATGDPAVLVEDVETNVNTTVAVTYESGGDLVIAGLTEVENNSMTPEDVTVDIEDTSGFPGEHVAHVIRNGALSQTYAPGDTVSPATAEGILDNEAATVFDATLNITDQEYEDATTTVEVNTSDLQPDTASDYQVIIHNNTAGLPVLGNSTVVSGTQDNLTVTLDQEINQTTDVLAMLHFPDATSEFGPAIPAVDGSAFGQVTDTATVEIQQAENGNVDFQAQALGTSSGSPAVLAENVESVDVVTVNDAFDPQDDFLVLTNGTEVTGPDNVLDFVQLSQIPEGADQALNATGATPGTHTVVLHEPNATGTGPDPTAPRTDASTGEVVNATATVFDATVTITDQQYEDNTTTVEVNTSDVQPEGETDYQVVIHNASDGTVLGNSTVVSGAQTNLMVTVDELNSTTDVLAMLHFPSATSEFGPAIPAVDGSAFGQVTDTATVEIQQAENGNVDFQAQALGTSSGSPAVLAENVESVDVVTVNDAFDPQDDFLVLTNGTEVTGPDNVLDFVQLSQIPEGADQALNATGATPGTHTVVLHEPNATGTGPDPDAPRTDASTGEVVNATATVFDATVNITDQTYEDNTTAVEVNTSDVQPESETDYQVVIHNASDGTVLGNSTVVSGTQTNLMVTVDELNSTTDVLAMLHFPDATSEFGPAIPAVDGSAFGQVTDTATVEIQQAENGNVDFQAQALGTSSGSPAVLAENVESVDVVTVNDAFDPQDDFLVLTNGTEVTGPDNVLDFVQLSQIPEGADQALNATGATPGTHTVVLHEPNATGTGPDPDAPRTDASTGEVVNATATVFDATLNITDQTYEDNTTTVEVNTSDLQPDTASDYQVIIHNNTAGLPVLGNSTVVSGTQDNLTVTLDQEINQTTDLLAMLHFPDATSEFGSPIPAVDGSAFGQVTDTATVSIVEGQVTITDSPSTVERGETQDGQVEASVTADEVTASSASIEVRLVFEGIEGEPEAVLGSETIELDAGESGTVTFTGLDPIPGNATAVDGVPANLRVETTNDADTATTDLSNPIQKAVDFAGANGISTVDVRPGTYDESVTVDVAGLTVEGPNAGTDGASSTRGPEAVVTSGLQAAADNVTIDGLQVESTDTNGIRFGPNTVPSNVTIQNSVLTNVTGSVGGKSAGNGIQFQFGNVANETAENIRILDNEISNISTPDATNAETIAIGVNVLPRGNNVSLKIRGNTFDNIEPGTSTNNRAEARGVSLSTQDDNENGFGRVDGAVVTNNTFSNIAAGDIVRAVALFEEDDLDPREGVKNFSVTRNNFTSLSGADVTTTGAVFVGGYETLGPDHEVTENNFDSGGVLRFAENQPGFTPADAENLNAVENWWGNESGPSGAGPGVGNPVSENVTFDPWLDAPYPAGQPVSDNNIDIFDLDADSEGVAGELLNATATIENGLEPVGTNQGRELVVEHRLNTDDGTTVLNSTTVEVVAGQTKRVEFSSVVPENVSDVNASHRIQVDTEFVRQDVTIRNSNVTFSGQVLGTDATGDLAVLVEDVETNVNTTVAVTYESGGDLVIAGLTGVANNSMTPEDVTVDIENTSGFPGEHVAHVIRNDTLSQAYAPGDTVSESTAEGILENEAAAVLDGSVRIDDQTFEDNTSQVTVNASDLQPTSQQYQVVVHNQTGVASGGVGPAIGFSANLTGAESNVTVSLTEEINRTTDLLAMVHLAGNPVGTAIPTLNDTAFGIGDGQAGTVTDTATATVVESQVTVTATPGSADRGDDIGGTVEAEVTANEVTGQNTAEITVELVFEGVAGEADTVLGNETIRLGAGESGNVTFTDLDALPNATTASDGEPLTLRVDANRDSDTGSVDISHSVQNAVDFAVADGQSAVDILADTYVEEVTIPTDNATIAGAGTSTTTIDGNVTVTGDNNTLENFTIDGNLTLDGSNNDVSNVTVTGSTNSQTVGTYQAPGGGNVFVNGDATLTNLNAEVLEVSTTVDVALSDSTIGEFVSENKILLEDAGGLAQGVFDSVQTAVDNAGTDATVTVAPGTYSEGPVVDVVGLTLDGPNAGTPGNDTAARGDEATITQGVEVNASGVTLDGLDITSSDVNGILLSEAPSQVTVTNTVVRDIDGETAGESKGVGNGINLQFNGVSEQTSTGIEITDNLITRVTTPDASGTDPDADAIGVQLLPRGNDVVDLRIANNTIEDIEPGAAPGGRSEARAVSIATQFTDSSGTRGDLGQATGLTVADNDISNFTADFARAVNLFEDADGDTTTNNALGPVNFTVTGNNVSEMDSTSSLPDLALFVGEYGDFGAEHSVQQNNLLAGVENFGSSSDNLTATENWWGNQSGPAFDGPGTGPGFVIVDGGIDFDPWLDAPVGQGDTVSDEFDVAVDEGASDGSPDSAADEDVFADGETLSIEGEVSNELVEVTANDGREATIQHVLVAAGLSGGETVLQQTTKNIVPNRSVTVSFDSTVPSGLGDIDATHRLRVAEDGTEDGLELTVDSISPTVASQTPSEGDVVDNAEPEILLTVEDSTTGIDEGSITVDLTDASGAILSGAGTDNSAVSFDAGAGELTVNVSETTAGAFADGPVDANVTAADNASNADEVNLTFEVDTSAVENVDRGTGFDSLQAAIDDGQTQDGDTLVVGDETLVEDVTVDKNQLTISGAGESQTVIDGNVTVTGDDDTIENLTIQGDYDDQGSDNTLDNVTVTSASPGGTVTLAGPNAQLTAVTVEELVANASGLAVTASTVGADGVTLQDGVGLTLDGTTVDGADTGILVSSGTTGGDSVRVTGGSVVQNIGSTGIEIESGAGANVTVEGTTVDVNGNQRALVVAGGNVVTIDNNDFQLKNVDSISGVIDISGGTDVAFTNNLVDDDSQYGLQFETAMVVSGGDPVIQGNTFDDPGGVSNGGTGLEIDTALSAPVSGNTILNAEADGLIVSSGPVAIENNVFDGDRDGVNVDTGDAVRIAGNEFRNHAELSFSTAIFGNPLGEDLNVTVENNDIESNANGIRMGVSSAGEVTVTNNNIAGNSGVGVENFGDGILNATDNWWGASDGPSGGVTDPSTGATADGSGDAVSENVTFDPFYAQELTFVDSVSGLEGIDNDLDGVYILTDDINAGGQGIDPIAVESDRDFTGRLVGNGHSITNLEINTGLGIGGLEPYGLFGTTGSDAVIENFHIDVDITMDNVGGQFDEGRAGPIVGGEHAGVIRQVSTEGVITGEDGDANRAGGIVTNVASGGVVENSSSNVTIQGTYRFVVAGITYSNSGTIRDSFATGEITATNQDANAENAGVAYSNNEVITDSYWDTEATGLTIGVDSDTGTTTDVTGLTTSEMTGTSAETNMAGLDFVDVWETVSGDYPILQALSN
jgi:hypothetical protein